MLMDDLRFELSAQCGRSEARRPFPVQFRLVNGRTETLLVNGRLAVTATGRSGEVALRASGPNGREVPFIADVNVGRPRPEHFATLPPGGFVERGHDLSRYLLLDEPGEYEISAVYSNDISGVDGVSGVAWTGERSAEPLLLTITVPDT